jgi:hypothetical protein
MNNTTNNQGDHCIFPFGGAPIDTRILVLDRRGCEALKERINGLVARFLVVLSLPE